MFKKLTGLFNKLTGMVKKLTGWTDLTNRQKAAQLGMLFGLFCCFIGRFIPQLFIKGYTFLGAILLTEIVVLIILDYRRRRRGHKSKLGTWLGAA